jgi:hypothetical protein
MLRGVPAIKAARSKPLLSQGIIRVGLRSWLAWVTCQGRSGTQRDGPRGCYSRSRLGALAAKQMLKPRLRLSAQGIREESVPAKKGLYANINAKKKRIAAGSGEKMRKPGSKGAPSARDFKESAKTAKKKK